MIDCWPVLLNNNCSFFVRFCMFNPRPFRQRSKVFLCDILSACSYAAVCCSFLLPDPHHCCWKPFTEDIWSINFMHTEQFIDCTKLVVLSTLTTNQSSALYFAKVVDFHFSPVAACRFLAVFFFESDYLFELLAVSFLRNISKKMPMSLCLFGAGGLSILIVSLFLFLLAFIFEEGNSEN